MKNLLLLLSFAVALSSCGDSTESSNPSGSEHAEKAPVSEILLGAEPMDSMEFNEPKNFGQKISTDNAVPSDQIMQKFATGDSMPMKISGKINACCQKKGCWMTMDIGNGEEMRVSFIDYSFFVPKNATGRMVTVDGMIYREVIDVESLRHFAEDDGKSPEEIAAITQPETQITFVAKGAIINP